MQNTMDKKRLFRDVFYEITTDEELLESFSHGFVSKIKFNKSSGRMEIHLEMPGMVKVDKVFDLEESLSGYFNVPVSVIPHFKTNKIDCVFVNNHKEDFIRVMAGQSGHYECLLENAEFMLEGKNLYVHLSTNGGMILQAGNCHKQLEKFFNDCFGASICVSFIDPPFDEDERKSYIRNKTVKEAEAVKKIIYDTAEKAGINNNKKITENTPVYKHKNGSVIYGRDFSDEAVPMSEVTIDSGRITVKGKVIRIETRPLKNGRVLFSFDITDYTHTLTVKCFLTEKQLASLSERIHTNDWLLVNGDAQYDTFGKELTVRAKAIRATSVAERIDNAVQKRVELHLHTKMSQMDAITPVEAVVERAAKWGHKAVAITDHGVVQAFPDAHSAAKKHGIKIIYGVEIYLLGEEKTGKKGQIDYKNTDTFHAILLVENKTGLKNLYRLISESHLNYFYKRPRVPKSVLAKYREGLILGSACESGEVYRAVAAGKSDEEIIKIAELYDYLEIQPIGNNGFMVGSGEVSGYEELREYNRKIVEIGRVLNKPVVATCDVHFLDPEDEIFRRILQAGQGYDDAESQAPLFFRTTEEMLQEFSYLGEETAFEIVVKNTQLISDRIDDICPVPDGTFPPCIDGAEEEIKKVSEEKAASLYGDPLPELVRKRLDKELDSIIKNGFSVMYIIARKLVLKSIEDGYLVGSRGSVGSSFVAYLIGITEVNSLPAHYRCENCLYSEFFDTGCGFDLSDKKCPKCGQVLQKDGYDIPFETFLGFDGDKEPDIDLNFSGEYQLKAHKNTEELFGKQHVFRAGTIATIAEKTAFGFVKGYLDEKGITATNAEINRLVAGCTGVKRTTGQHPGGVMIVPHNMEIYDFSPVQRPADDVDSNVITTHFDYNAISGRILKLDILGHDDPTMIKMLQDITNVDPKTIPIGEKMTMEIFRSTEPLGVSPQDIGSEVGTFGIPEFGTRFVRQMLVETRPSTFSELVRISGLSHGTDVWANNAQDLIKNNIATLSNVITTRDDIMISLINYGIEPLSAFKIMEDVRKGKGLTEEYEETMKKAGVPGWYIDSCKKIKYMFPKAHAAAYVMMAFRIAWFKVHYPHAFYAAYFTVRADEFDADIVSKGRDTVLRSINELEKKGNDATQREKNLLTILEVANEMYARGINCLPVDLYESDAARFIITDKGILPPLNTLQGLGESAARRIADARKKGPFLSVDDLKIRAGVSKSVIEILDNHGCLSGMHLSNQICFL
ncbi:MAG TPA: PolC-type DNA polymerase III [Ruminiclostridium sp.]|nr:PolC-type DNA polymerase III [Clostridiaceae bacterium]HAA24944.1 PolC-type DNA polymerase III [Ruminiclostridium sp.]